MPGLRCHICLHPFEPPSDAKPVEQAAQEAGWRVAIGCTSPVYEGDAHPACPGCLAPVRVVADIGDEPALTSPGLLPDTARAA